MKPRWEVDYDEGRPAQLYGNGFKPAELEECAVCDEPLRVGEDRHWDIDGHGTHPECCGDCNRPSPRTPGRAA